MARYTEVAEQKLTQNVEVTQGSDIRGIRHLTEIKSRAATQGPNAISLLCATETLI